MCDYGISAIFALAINVVIYFLKQLFMKRLLFFFVALCALQHAQATERRVVTASELAAFFQSTTYVVVTNDNIILDALLSNAAQRLWTVTPHRVADVSEFDRLKTDSTNSFLMVTRVVESRDRLRRPYLHLTLLMGNPNAATSFDAMPEVASIPFATVSADNETSTTVMLPAMVLFVQQHAENSKDNAFASRLLVSFQQRLQVYNQDMGQLRGKTIYINRSDVDSQSEILRQEARQGNVFRFVDENEIARVVNSREENAAVAFCVTPQGAVRGAFGYKMVMGVDGALYYYYPETNPRNFLFRRNDFDMIMRSAR